MQRFDLVEKLKAAEDQVSSLNGELRAFVSQFIESHRKFANGQKVEVFDFNGRSYGVGFIKEATCNVDFRRGSPTRWYKDSDEWVKALSDIMYLIVKAKKDGTPSERTLMWDKPRQEKQQDGYHLIPVE